MSKQDIIDLRNELKTATPERREQIKRQLNGKFDPDDDSVLLTVVRESRTRSVQRRWSVSQVGTVAAFLILYSIRAPLSR